MTAKEKAEELISKYLIFFDIEDSLDYLILQNHSMKKFALVAVDEIINSSPLEPNFADWDDCGGEDRFFHDAQKTHAFHFWQEVKKEIEKL